MKDKLIVKEHFPYWAYSKKSHLEEMLVPVCHRNVDINLKSMKYYQDIFIYNFLIQNIRRGSKVLEIGGGSSRIAEIFQHYYDYWMIDKYEGVGNGPKEVPEYHNVKLVQGYIGEFLKDLPSNYFDCVISISVLEHVPSDYELCQSIIKDIDRVLMHSGFSAHCFDSILRSDYVWHSEMSKVMETTCLSYALNVEFSDFRDDPDLWCMTEEAYNRCWKPITKDDYEIHGKPFSVNQIYQKKTGMFYS